MVRSQYLCQLELESNGFITTMRFGIAMFYIGLRLFCLDLLILIRAVLKLHVHDLYPLIISAADEDLFIAKYSTGLLLWAGVFVEIRNCEAYLIIRPT